MTTKQDTSKKGYNRKGEVESQTLCVMISFYGCNLLILKGLSPYLHSPNLGDSRGFDLTLRIFYVTLRIFCILYFSLLLRLNPHSYSVNIDVINFKDSSTNKILKYARLNLDSLYLSRSKTHKSPPRQILFRSLGCNLAYTFSTNTLDRVYDILTLYLAALGLNSIYTRPNELLSGAYYINRGFQFWQNLLINYL